VTDLAQVVRRSWQSARGHATVTKHRGVHDTHS